VVRLQLALALVGFCVFVYCLVDAIRTPEDEVRNLPKTVWLLIVLFFPFVGSIAWLVAGRPKKVPRTGGGYPRSSSQFPEYDRPGRAAASNPDDDEEFLRQVRRRAEEQRRRLEEQRDREEKDGPTPPSEERG
jgi:hypothetical protein